MLSLLLAPCVTTNLQAHQANAVSVKTSLESAGTYKVAVSIDVIASPDAAMNDTISPEEAALEVVRDIALQFDEEEFSPEFSEMEELPVADQQGVTRLYSETTGEIPKGASQFFLHLMPEAQVALVMAVFKNGTMDRRTHVLFPGEYSRPIDLSFVGMEVAETDPFEADHPPSYWQSFRSGIFYLITDDAKRALALLLLCLFARSLSQAVTQGLTFALASMIGHWALSVSEANFPINLLAALMAISILLLAADNIVRARMGKSRYVSVALAGLVCGLAVQFPLISDDKGRFVCFHLGELIGIATLVSFLWLVLGSYWKHDWYRQKLLMPGSFLVAGASIYWVVASLA